MVIIETAVFTKIIKTLMTDDEYKDLQEALITRPDKGAIIKNSNGIRKIRWTLEGRGKSGGVRVIYYWMTEDEHIYMLYAYPKSAQENLTDAQLKVMKQIVEGWNHE